VPGRLAPGPFGTRVEFETAPSLSANPIQLIVCLCRPASMFDPIFQRVSMLTIRKASSRADPRRVHKCGPGHGLAAGRIEASIPLRSSGMNSAGRQGGNDRRLVSREKRSSEPAIDGPKGLYGTGLRNGLHQSLPHTEVDQLDIGADAELRLYLAMVVRHGLRAEVEG
jgi:hypothetical protein